MDELRQWLNTECEQRNLSWREASIRAGLYAESISAIMNGQRPGLETCKALAEVFGTSTEYVLQLAEHLPAPPDPDAELEAELRGYIDILIEKWRRVKDRDPASLQALINLAVTQAETVEAALRVAERHAQADRKEKEIEGSE